MKRVGASAKRQTAWNTFEAALFEGVDQLPTIATEMADEYRTDHSLSDLTTLDSEEFA